jgi:16S rRNA (cytosine1402-N4)-methyltransferase
MVVLHLQHESTAVADQHSEGQAGRLHEPVMVAEVLHALRPAPGETVLDLTLGTGGHALALGKAIGPTGRLIGSDADPSALDVARERLAHGVPCSVDVRRARFSETRTVLRDAGVEVVDCVLADLGVGSHQLGNAERGFAFDSEARLDMRFDTSSRPSAWDVVNRLPEQELADIFYTLGEERHSRQIAARICRQRADEPIDTPAQLAELVKHVAARRTPRGRTWRIHPATRVMMALRIYVNGELEQLDALLDALPDLLAPVGRVAIITYHSLEARRVKQAWRRQERDGLIEVADPATVKPSQAEVASNPRARSAQLRAARRPETR